MPQVKWWESQKVPGKLKFFEKHIQDILFDDWDKVGVEQKRIKISSGRSNLLEFILYKSDKYTKRQNKRYQNYPVILDKYQLVLTRKNLKRRDEVDHKRTKVWKASETALSILDQMDLIGERLPDENKWIDMDEMKNVINEIQELMENLEEYEVMDILMA